MIHYHRISPQSRFRGKISSKIREKAFKEEKPITGEISAAGIPQIPNQ